MANGFTGFPGSLDTISNLFFLTDEADSTLSISLNPSDTSITVTDGSKFPTGVQILTIEDEKILCSSRSGNIFTVETRGFDSSTATSHTTPTSVSLNFTRHHWNNIVNTIIALENAIPGGFALLFRFPNIEIYTTTDVSSYSGLTNILNGVSYTLTAGDKVLSGFDNQIYTVAVGSWTIAVYSPVIADNNAFIINQVASDISLQRGGAVFRRDSGIWIKYFDLDFKNAASIGFSSYSPPAPSAATDVVGTDTVQAAIEKLDTSVDNLISTLGSPNHATVNMGSYNGFSPFNQTLKALLQSLIDRAKYETSANTVTTIVTLDSVAHASIKSVEWKTQAIQLSDTSKVITSLILVSTDGTNSNTTYDETNIVRSNGTITGLNFIVDVSGSDLRLRVSSTSAVNVRATRNTIQA